MNLEKLVIREKKGWIRIVEAFTAILILMSALLIIVSQQKTAHNSDDEIKQIQSSILDYISQNEGLRGQILNGDTTGVYQFLSTSVPSALNYSAYICPYTEVCPNLAVPVDSPIAMYTQYRPIITNLTYSPDQSIKLQIYFWRK